MIGKTDIDGIIVLMEVHSTCLKHVFDFIVDNEQYIIVEDKKPLGFGG
jgi:hypothetical protein